MEDNKILTIEASKKPRRIQRVAAYCRVSTDSEDQMNSFAAQVQYYTNTINENPEMELADIYADEGISGTGTEKREEFNRLIEDCRKGKIDRILTKSLSRFARNTVDALTYARKIKEYGVTINFEKENIDTAYLSSEMLLVISGAQAQEESLSISRNMKWSYKRRMKEGTYVSGSTPFGFALQNGKFVKVPEEAKTVKLIFESFLSGMGKRDIAKMLNSMKAPKRGEVTPWREDHIGYILENERYIGDAVFQKTYTPDTLPLRNILNRGKLPKYYVEGANAPIVSKKDFMKVQEIIKSNKRGERKIGEEKALSGKIKCSCGHLYGSLTVNNKIYWECCLHKSDSKKCDSRRVPQEDIYEAFITVVNRFRNNYKRILTAAISQIEKLKSKEGGMNIRIKEIDRQIAELNGKILVLTRLNKKGILRTSEYAEQSYEITQNVRRLREERRKILCEQEENRVLSELKDLKEIFDELESGIISFDKKLFDDTVKEITFPNKYTVCFTMLGDLKLKERIPEESRCRRNEE